MLCIHCRKHAERHTNCHRYRCCVVELGCSPWTRLTRVSSGADVEGLRAPGVHATDVGARCDETGGCHKTPMPIVMVACRLQVRRYCHNATLSTTDDGGSSGPTNTSYYNKYKKRARSRGRGKASTWLDLELPVGAKCSWWRLDGYDTCDEGPGASAEGPTVDGMVELSLSDTDESSNESESD